MAAMSRDAAEVRAHLARILASPVFRNSKRCCRFLEYTVEHALREDSEPLKERTIGIELFGRASGYDTNEDPSVRVTANEVRKRLAQYYAEVPAGGRLRLSLLPGSYIPEVEHPEVAAAEAPAPVIAPPPGRRNRRVFRIGGAALACAAVILAWRAVGRPATSLDRFWNPLLTGDRPTVICMGMPDLVGIAPPKVRLYLRFLEEQNGSQDRPAVRPPDLGFKDLQPLVNRYVPFGDAMALSRLSVFLDRHRRSFRVRRSGSTEPGDLADNPAILVGAYTNEWFLRMADVLRFRFAEQSDGTQVIEDVYSGKGAKWAVEKLSGTDTRTYAVISRARVGDRYVLSLAGLTHPATNAASECVLSETCMAQAEARAGEQGWRARMLQILISTRVARGEPSGAEVVASYAW
jgi:hypothetical protein